MGMPVQAILFDLDDTLIVDEAISESAMEKTAALAAKLHGAEVARFLADAKSLSQSLWRDNPCLAYCDAIGITAEECLWGNFTGESPDLAETLGHTWKSAPGTPTSPRLGERSSFRFSPFSGHGNPHLPPAIAGGFFRDSGQMPDNLKNICPPSYDANENQGDNMKEITE